MRAVRRSQIIAAVLGISVLSTVDLHAQSSRRVDREQQLREQRLREQRLRDDQIDRLREQRLRADRYRDDHYRDHDLGELIRERVESALRRSHEALERAEMSRYRSEDFSRLGLDVQERVREALRDAEGRQFDREHALRMGEDARERAREALERSRHDGAHRELEGARMRLDAERIRLDSRELGEEVRARVREALERSEVARQRAVERSLDAARRSESRIRDWK